MLFSSLTRRLGIPPRPARRRPKPSFRPRLEALEDRVVPAAVLGMDLSTLGKSGGGTTGNGPSVYTSCSPIIRSTSSSLG